MRSSTRFRSTIRTAVLFPFLFLADVCSADPQALSVEFGPDFLGYDGLWSPAQIRVGTPEQYLLVFPSTISSETWVAGPDICSDPTCASRRGGIFYTGNSTSWETLGQYDLGFSELTETTESGFYGFDNLAISDSISASNQVIAVVDNVQQWNGQLGLGVGKTRFSNNTNYLGFLSTLVQNDSAIPSHSYAYTAGASYKGSGVLGSLTLGGADTSRYTPNNFWFTLADGYIPSIALKSMQVSHTATSVSWSSNPLEVFTESQAAMFTIDSSTPYLWLPQAVCDSIASALGLSWNADLELYIVDVISSQDLADMGLELTFNLAATADSNELLALKLSYDAFNLQLSYPFPGLSDNYTDSKVAYFPMRPANNTLQYTIGRAFLQETYLIVDYERNSFSLSQALFPENGQSPELAQISRPDDSGWPGPPQGNGSNGLSTGAKAGIAVAIAFIICVIAGLLWFFFRHKRTRGANSDDEKAHKNSIFSRFSRHASENPSSSASAAELNADKVHPSEMGSDSSNSRFELPTTAPIEMAGAEVSPSFFQDRSNARISQRNDPRSPVELVQPAARTSISKEPVEAGAAAVPRSTSIAPPYSPAHIDQRYSNTHSTGSHAVSPNSTHRSGDPSHGGSDHVISPITGSGSEHNRFSRENFSHTGSDSSRLLSPISPAKARSDGSNSPHLPTTEETHQQAPSGKEGSNRASLSPIPNNGQFPRRSPSRDSRFREALGENEELQTAPKPSASTTATGVDGRKSRFSWES